MQNEIFVLIFNYPDISVVLANKGVLCSEVENVQKRPNVLSYMFKFKIPMQNKKPHEQ